MGGIVVHRFQLGFRLVEKHVNKNRNLAPCLGHGCGNIVNTKHQCPICNIYMHPLCVKIGPNTGK